MAHTTHYFSSSRIVHHHPLPKMVTYSVIFTQENKQDSSRPHHFGGEIQFLDLKLEAVKLSLPG